MQLVLKYQNKSKIICIDGESDILNLIRTINTAYSKSDKQLTIESPVLLNKIVSKTFTEMQTINLLPGMLLGGDMNEEMKTYCLKQLSCKICRVCYCRNPIKAVRCRNRRCGNSARLRQKKTGIKK